MAGGGSKTKTQVDKLGCPVVGGNVTVTAKYEKDKAGKDTLSYFACDHDGKCGIPDWDPCPLYVTYRESKPKKTKK